MRQTKQAAPFHWKILARITTRQSVCCSSEKNAAPATMLFGFGSCQVKNTPSEFKKDPRKSILSGAKLPHNENPGKSYEY